MTPPQVMSPTTTSLRKLMSNTPRSLWASSSSLITSTTMTSPSVRRSFDACRRRADHSEEEGLSSCLSSSVSHDRTGKPVVCRLVSSAQETQRHNSENEQNGTLLERQREQILADCQTETRKHEFLSRLRQKKYSKVE